MAAAEHVDGRFSVRAWLWSPIAMDVLFARHQCDKQRSLLNHRGKIIQGLSPPGAAVNYTVSGRGMRM